MSVENFFPQPGRDPSAYILSQLHPEPAPTWEKHRQELEKDKEFRVLEYRPLRAAVMAELESPGSGQAKLEEGLIRYNSGFSTEAMITTMRKAYALFFDKFRSSVTAVHKNWTGFPNPRKFQVGEHTFTGAFHGEVTHKRYGRCLVYIYASQWEEKKVQAFQELLIMMAEQCFGCDAKHVLWMDLREGTLRPLVSHVKVRKALILSANHYYKNFVD